MGIYVNGKKVAGLGFGLPEITPSDEGKIATVKQGKAIWDTPQAQDVNLDEVYTKIEEVDNKITSATTEINGKIETIDNKIGTIDSLLDTINGEVV